MLTWETVKVVAYLSGFSYTITRGEPDEWVVEITDVVGGTESEVCRTIEEAKRFCENTAVKVQAEQS